MSADAIRFDDVSFSFGDLPVLVGVGFELAPGELVHLVGRSGAGKTTLLRLAHGQLRPRMGRVIVDGVPILRGGDRRLWRRVHMVFQDSRLLPRLTVLENVTYALRVIDLGLSMGEARHRARDALCDAGLEERLDAFRGSCRRGRGSGWPSHAPSPAPQRSSSPTSLRPAWTPLPRMS